MSLERLWHKSYAPGVPTEFEPEKITMAERLSQVAAKYPDRVAFVYMGKKSPIGSMKGSSTALRGRLPISG